METGTHDHHVKNIEWGILINILNTGIQGENKNLCEMDELYNK